MMADEYKLPIRVVPFLAWCQEHHGHPIVRQEVPDIATGQVLITLICSFDKSYYVYDEVIPGLPDP